MKTTVTMEFGPDDDVEGWFCSIRDNERLNSVLSRWLRAVTTKVIGMPDTLPKEQKLIWIAARDLMIDLMEAEGVNIDY